MQEHTMTAFSPYPPPPPPPPPPSPNTLNSHDHSTPTPIAHNPMPNFTPLHTTTPILSLIYSINPLKS